MKAPDPLVLPPIRRIEGVVTLPGSKSLSNRILLLAALAEGETRIENLLDSDDVRVMVAALRQLGVAIAGELTEHSLRVQGVGGPLPNTPRERRLFLGNAGTAMRPLAAVLAAGQGRSILEGVPRMHERPIGDLVEGLRMLGATIRYLGQPGFPPIEIEGGGLAGGHATISGATSSQFLSALLLAAPLARAAVTVSIRDRLVSWPYAQMTLALMARFGVRVEAEPPRRFGVPAGQRYRSPGRMWVEGDASSASYFLAGAAITGGRVRVEGVGRASLQGDARFAMLLERMGARVRWEDEAIEVEGKELPLRAIDADLQEMPDAAMTLAVTALFADGPSTLRGIAHWRVKETDRMAAVAAELEKLGARAEAGEDSLTIRPPARWRSAVIDTYEDHRMAMAFSLAACGPEPVAIRDPGCVRKTFPDYFDELARLAVPRDAA
jgi:3-phosphoshikimate 1-carboxyvinyltransferase